MMSMNHTAEMRAYNLYLLGFFYYKIKDYYSSLEKFRLCTEINSKIKASAEQSLDTLWNNNIPFCRGG